MKTSTRSFQIPCHIQGRQDLFFPHLGIEKPSQNTIQELTKGLELESSHVGFEPRSLWLWRLLSSTVWNQFSGPGYFFRSLQQVLARQVYMGSKRVILTCDLCMRVHSSFGKHSGSRPLTSCSWWDFSSVTQPTTQSKFSALRDAWIFHGGLGDGRGEIARLWGLVRQLMDQPQAPGVQGQE